MSTEPRRGSPSLEEAHQALIEDPMAQARFIPLLTAATGLCNTRDPVRLEYDLKTGESQLAMAVNVDIDQSGRVNRCRGYTLKRNDASHSAFSDGSRCLYVSETSLYRLLPDYSRELLRSDLTEGRRMSYWPVGPRVYYANGAQKGYVDAHGDHAWVKGDVTRPDDNRAFIDPPNGHLICFAFGRMLVARDGVIFASEPSFYGNFDLARFHAEGERITMLRPAEGGLWVGTRSKVLFYRGQKWEEVVRVPVAEYGVIEGTDDWCAPEKLRLEGLGKRAIVLTTPEGVCACGDGGVFRNLTHDTLTFPSAFFGTGKVLGNRYLVLLTP